MPRFKSGWRKIPWTFWGTLLLGSSLRWLLYVGVTGARDDHNEYTNSIYGWTQFPSLTWPSFNRLSIVLPKNLLFYLFGPSEFSCVALTFAASIGCIALAYAIGTRLFDREHGLYAALLMAVSPLDLILSSAPWATDIVSSFYIGVAVLAAWVYFKKETWPWAILAGLAFLLAYRGKELSLLILIPVVYLLFQKPKQAIIYLLAALGFLCVDALFCHWKSGVWFPDRQAMHYLFGNLNQAVMPLDWKIFWESKSRILLKGRVLGLFPLLFIGALVGGGWGMRQNRGVRFVFLWLGLFFGILLFKPAGWSPSQGFLTVWWDFPRYYALLLIPGTLLVSACFVALKNRFHLSWLPGLLCAVVGVHSIFTAIPVVRIGKNHRAWMGEMNQMLRALPMGSPVMIDQNFTIWLRFKDPQASKDYTLHETVAENSYSRGERLKQLGEAPLMYVITGGPRGLETPDQWRLDRNFVLNVAPQAERVTARDPGSLVFDDYYQRRDPTEVWKVTHGS